jgi:hypothetical protein
VVLKYVLWTTVEVLGKEALAFLALETAHAPRAMMDKVSDWTFANFDGLNLNN